MAGLSDGESCTKQREQSHFRGLIQHSFALRIDKSCQHFRGQDTRALVTERFSFPRSAGDEFCVVPVGDLASKKSKDDLSPHSLLVRRGLTTVEPQGIAFLERHGGGYANGLPKAFSWADDTDEKSEARMILAHNEEDGSLCLNDFLVERARCTAGERKAMDVSRVLCQTIAHQRSLLFGLALASRFVNVMLPHAVLTPAPGERNGGPWLLQPLVSLIRTGHSEGDPIRRMYTLTLFLIPVDGSNCKARKVSRKELTRMVNASWNVASSRKPNGLPRFELDDPLRGYLSLLDPTYVPTLLHTGQLRGGHVGAHARAERLLTLRQLTEGVMFAVALRMAQGPTGYVEKQARLCIGNDVVTALGSARVSSVVVVDKWLKRKDLANEKRLTRDDRDGLPGALGKLMEKLAEDARIPKSKSVASHRRYRLDRAYFDDDRYALGVLPSSRCLVLVSPEGAQNGRKESGLIQAGWVAYMTIGAATAIGTMRAIDLDLERLEGSDPMKVADIEREVTVGLHEIYDLDITRESYRHLYRLLRKRLGITNDYKALMEKMQALYRETTASHEAEAQARLMWLTAAIVMLSLLILIGTIVLATKGK